MTYAKIRDANGLVRDDLVLRSDGVFVLTAPHADDPDAEAYQLWLSQGNVPSGPAP